MKRAAGLGKRKLADAPDGGEGAMAPPEGIEGGAEMMFPLLDEEQDDIEQVSGMLSHAQLALDHGERLVCLPLFKAVVHECDRIFKVKDLIESGSTEGLDDGAIERLSTLTITARLFRIFGDGLYYLGSLVEAPAEEKGSYKRRRGGKEQSKEGHESSKVEYLEAAIRVYRDGLNAFPECALLMASLERARLLRCLCAEDKDCDDEAIGAIVGAFLDIPTSEDGSDCSIVEELLSTGSAMVRLLEDASCDCELIFSITRSLFARYERLSPASIEASAMVCECIFATLDALSRSLDGDDEGDDESDDEGGDESDDEGDDEGDDNGGENKNGTERVAMPAFEWALAALASALKKARPPVEAVNGLDGSRMEKESIIGGSVDGGEQKADEREALVQYRKLCGQYYTWAGIYFESCSLPQAIPVVDEEGESITDADDCYRLARAIYRRLEEEDGIACPEEISAIVDGDE